jgi:hypothetical protein
MPYVMARWDTMAAFEAEFMAADTDRRWGLLTSIIDHVTIAGYTGTRRDPNRVQVTCR